MKICPKCKREYPDEVNFCDDCGVRLDEPGRTADGHRPFYNGKWFGFKGRIGRWDYLNKFFLLYVFSFIGGVLVTSFVNDFSRRDQLFLFHLPGWVWLLMLPIWAAILMEYGLQIRRFRDTGLAVWKSVVLIFVLPWVISQLLGPASLLIAGTTVYGCAPTLYLYFTDSRYEAEVPDGDRARIDKRTKLVAGATVALTILGYYLMQSSWVLRLAR